MDLIIYAPNHGYSESDYIYVSWLDGNYYVRDVDSKSFKISTDDSDDNLVQFTETITSGYVREINTTGSTEIAGLDHLIGEQVYVTSGGNNLGLYTVSATGTVTLASEIYTYQVGKPFGFKLRTMRFAIPQASDALQTKVKRIGEVSARVIRTKGGQAGQEKNGIEYLNDMNAEFSTQSSDKSLLVRGGFSPDGYVVAKSVEPYPMSVLATVVEITDWEQ